MIVTMDHAGRIVIPKPLRDSEGLAAGAELAIRAEAGAIVLEVPVTPVRIELRDGLPLMLPASPLPALTTAAVEAQIARHRLRGAGGLESPPAADQGHPPSPPKQLPKSRSARNSGAGAK